MGKVPYRENDRPVGAAVPEGMEGTMSSPVSLFKTAALVVDLPNGKGPLGQEAKYQKSIPPQGGVTDSNCGHRSVAQGPRLLSTLWRHYS